MHAMTRGTKVEVAGQDFGVVLGPGSAVGTVRVRWHVAREEYEEHADELTRIAQEDYEARLAELAPVKEG